MGNDRETKSYEMKPERPQDTSAAIRANDGETMSGGKDADVRPHKEAGSSGAGLPPMPDNEMTISARDGIREARPRRKPGAEDER